MAARGGEQALKPSLADSFTGLCEALPDEGSKLGRRDHADLELLGAAPERFILVVEDTLEDVALAAEVDVAHFRLGLEYRTHQVRESAVERDHLLEFVENDHDPALAATRPLARADRAIRSVRASATHCALQCRGAAAPDRLSPCAAGCG